MSLALKFSGRFKSGGPLALALFLASAAYSLVPRYTVGTGITWSPGCTYRKFLEFLLNTHSGMFPCFREICV